ncbi:HAD family hydrolase [Microbulbifer sp. 2205BS26-8]|uniref:HAD family hydrolase n=1 Tax=Microbulbifer sp. 2205BS26-8 TaxID=3064386 RepID=UPI00273FFF61|nr:HAD-IA family hydrolase [Microbulbifer sp. 2205BS26-8]MDP5209735.1 HAD-IA family hydrolase [Microbulbifer sp. 2205BS26-8]
MKAVLFDLDGTLLDTAPDFIVVLNQLRQQEQLSALPDEIIRSTVSNGSRALVTLGFGKKAGDPGFNSLLQRLLDLYLAHLAEKTIPFPGIEALLNTLLANNISWGIVTNKPEAFTVPLMQAFNYLPPPAAVICPDHVNQPKPDPEAIFLACTKIGCDPSEAVYIGDHKRDIVAGQRAGMPTIACNYGYIDVTENPASWGADHLIQSAAEIWPLLREQYFKP